MNTKKAKSNCWTCKERKVGCDKTLPACDNCTRSKRVCKGYGLKLAWPDKFDGRRKQKKYQADPESSATRYLTDDDGRFVFLNTTFDDVEGRKTTWEEFLCEERSRRGVGGLRGALTIHGVEGGRAELLSYYDSVVARMITTIDDDTNGFRLNLIPMALSSTETSSKSLLEATLALAAFHVGREEDALKHKVRAIRLLSDSIQSPHQNKIAQFSTCMMLCVYSVFDSSDTTWNLHLQGAKSVTQAFSEIDRSNPSIAFMMHWLQYHDIFSAYSHSPNPSEKGTKPIPTIVLPESTPKNQQIIGLLGCSLELLTLISHINTIRHYLSSTTTTTTSTSQQTRSPILTTLLHLRTRLLTLKQSILVHPGTTTGPISQPRISLTAELYRIATLLYLFQTITTHFPASTISSSLLTTSLTPSSSSSPSPTTTTATLPSSSLSDESRALTSRGLALLSRIPICTSPWPLFIIACNVTNDDAGRIAVMRIIERGGRERRVGNYGVVRGLVEGVWRRGDLLGTLAGGDGGGGGSAGVGAGTGGRQQQQQYFDYSSLGKIPRFKDWVSD
ncbi:hypothetical protein DM02DRAFT_730495 [Periconia macrospinosa]|uniref:Zn(2)-C6 fungal-type domain-containing protein n=1 Tax=Periconia macrospinosa TaxID=97972 RepID=A0A2V1DHN8_9PLEO|nr:hypothetical protein DM02DRAFT_730495 [Periconia macrospinosa]